MASATAQVKIQIKHRYTDAVLYEHETTVAMRDALEAVVKSRANLSGAYLSGALSGANLSDANLSGAKWCDGITISKAPLQLSGLTWMVYILDQHMQIGCELHSLADWQSFDDRRIGAMDGRDALRFWRDHKDSLLSLAKAAGRSFEPVTEPTAEAA
jgi:pentapeptide repeat protein